MKKHLLFFQINLLLLLNCIFEPAYKEWYHIYRVLNSSDSTAILNASLIIKVNGGDKQYEVNTEWFCNAKTDTFGRIVDWTCSYEIKDNDDFKNLSYSFSIQCSSYHAIDTIVHGRELLISNDSVYFPIFYLRK